ncbi:MAG: O-antigen ligase family protein, partial [Planctomycetota bacterium]
PFQETTSGFGSFVNRNNAAVFLNLGLGASIGGIIWRLKQPTFSNFEEQEFEWDSLFDVLHDKLAMACGISACFCFAAILLCGSGVGLIGLIFGTLSLINWFRSRISIVAIVILFSVFSIGIAAVCLSPSMREYVFANLALSAESNTGPADARVYHWQDGWQAARESLPLGSGFGSYSDAYLPFQTHSPAAWFKHADNLWLELAVEQGYLGLLLVVAMLAVLGIETYRLSRSDDPVDAGLNSAMRFMIGVVVTTQFFDFGMLLPANCLLFAVVAGATVGRGQIVAYLSQMKPTEIPGPPSKVAIGLVSGAGVLAILMSLIALPKLRSAAWEESVLKSGTYLLATDARNRDALNAHVERLDELRNTNPTAAVFNQSATFRHRVARLVDVDSQQLETQEQIAAAYRETNLERKRLMPVDATDPLALRHYREAREHATESLRRRPFSIDARARWIYLDFVDAAPNRSSAAMRQLAELQRREPKQLARIGKLAEDSGHLRLARDCFSSAAAVSPVFASEAVLFVARNPTVSLIEAIPRHPTCIKRVARYLIREDNAEFSLRDQTSKYLRFAIETLDPESEPTRVQRARSETLIADIFFHLEDWKAGLNHYRLAAEASPADQAVRLTYVQRLLDTGYYDIALLEARKGRAQFPGSQRFQTLINRMAAMRVSESDDSDRPDAP